MATESGSSDEAVRDVLIHVRALLAEPERWTQLAFARDERDNYVATKDPDARSWCLSGAIQCVAPDLETEVAARQAVDRLLGEYVWIEIWNDAPTRTHAEVLALLDRAIASLEAARNA